MEGKPPLYIYDMSGPPCCSHLQFLESEVISPKGTSISQRYSVQRGAKISMGDIGIGYISSPSPTSILPTQKENRKRNSVNSIGHPSACISVHIAAVIQLAAWAGLVVLGARIAGTGSSRVAQRRATRRTGIPCYMISCSSRSERKSPVRFHPSTRTSPDLLQSD